MALDKYKIEALITESKNLDSADGDFSISYLGRKIDYKNTMNYTLESSSMEDSYVYKTMNKNNDVITMFTKILGTAIYLKPENIPEQFIQLKRMASSPLNKTVMEAYSNGLIELVYSKEIVSSNVFPFIVRRNNGRIVASVFVSTFGTLNSTADNLNIPIKNLYALMESAYIALKLSTEGVKLARNSSLMKVVASIYSEMIVRAINKDYTIALMRDVYSRVIFAITYFFLVNIWGINKDMAVSYSYNITQEKLGQSYNIGISGIDVMIEDYDRREITTFPDLISFLSEQSPRLSKLSTRYFLERFMNTYNSSTVLCLDYLPMMFYVISATLTGSFLVNQTALGDMIKNTKGINSYYSELSRL